VKSTGSVLVIGDAGGVVFGKKGFHRARLKTDYDARNTLDKLGFEVLPSARSGHSLRLRWRSPEEPFSLPRVPCDLGSARALKGAILTGKVPAIDYADQVQAALRTLYQAREYECYRQLARDLERLGITVPDRNGKPFVTMVPELKDIEILSIRSLLHRSYQGQETASYEVKIKVRDRTIRLVGPDFLDWDAFVSNVRNGLQDLAQTPFLKVVKQVEIDVGSKGTSRAHASAHYLTGKITFFRQPGSSYYFTDRIFHHEVGHLIADRIDPLRLFHRFGRCIIRAGEASPLTRPARFLYQPGHPGRRFQKLWERRGSHTTCGKKAVEEGFPEAYADCMVGRDETVSTRQRRFVSQLGIPNTFASSHPNSMTLNPVRATKKPFN
jgi:hypothetical protein